VKPQNVRRTDELFMEIVEVAWSLAYVAVLSPIK
jgi:hypothetical protein